MERSGLEGLAAKGQLQGAGRAAPGLAAGIAKGAYGLAKGMVYDPIAAVGDMLNWQRITSPDNQVFYVDPEGREYSESEYQKEVLRRTLGMTLSATGLMSAPGVAPRTGPNVVAGANRLSAPEIPVAEVFPPKPRNWGRAPVIHNATSEIPVADVLPPKPRDWGRAPVIHDVTPEIPVADVLPPKPRDWGRAPVVHDVMPEPTAQLPTSKVPQLTSSVPPFPPPSGRAPMPTPPPAGAPQAAVKSWFGKLSAAQKAGLGIGAGAVGYALMRKAADKASKQATPEIPFESMWNPYTQTQTPAEQSSPTAPTAPTGKGKSPAPMPSRAASVLRAAAAAGGQPAPQASAEAPSGAAAQDKVPVTTTGKPDYNYYAEMMNAADRNDAYARDLINLKEQARMAAIDAGARGEKFRFVPVKDYMNNRIIFVNAGGNDVVLDMNDPRQGVEYQKLLEKSGVDAATMTDWMHRSSKPMLRYMQPAGGNRDVTPDFGYMRRSVELGEGKPAAQATAPTFTPMAPPAPQADKEQMPTPTATLPTRPEPQPTSVAAIDQTRPAAGMEPAMRRETDLDWGQYDDNDTYGKINKRNLQKAVPMPSLRQPRRG